MPVRVREAAPVDYAAVAEVTLAAYREHADAAYRAVLADVAGRARDSTILLAELVPRGEKLPGAPRVVGAVALAWYPSRVAEAGGPGEAVFRMLGVDPAARSRGAGTALVRACIDRARASGARALVLSTMPEMTDAHRMYERLGFLRAPERDWSPREPFRLRVYVLPLRDPSAVAGAEPD